MGKKTTYGAGGSPPIEEINDGIRHYIGIWGCVGEGRTRTLVELKNLPTKTAGSHI